MNKILYIDENKSLFEKLSDHLMPEHIIELSDNINECMSRIESGSYSLIAINPAICADWIFCTIAIRKKSNIPILIVSNTKNLTDEITALRIGADDYLVMTSEPMELALHIRSWVRRYTEYSRYSEQPKQRFDFKGLTVDASQYIAYKDKVPLNLTKTEFDILYLLASHRGQTFSRDMIYSNIWNDDMLDDRSITTHIQRLRKKIEDDPDNPNYILTVRGVGYKFNRELTQ